MPSRRKMCAKLRITVVVPAPEEPVTAMIGCLTDMRVLTDSDARFRAEQRALVEQRRAEWPVGATLELGVVAFDALDFVARTHDQRYALVQLIRLHLHDALVTGRRQTARLLDEQADRVGLVQQAQSPCPAGVFGVARIHEDTTAHQD